jgi:O-antigen/teichoic acid export membrane protein
MVMAPILVSFYGDPRLFWVTVAAAGGLLLTAMTVQHLALLERQLRFVSLTVIETLSQLVSVAVGIVMAIGGFGYWSLVASTIMQTAIIAVGVWSVAPWIPGLPRRTIGILPMLRSGGTITLSAVISYVSNNADKILLGRFWGADVLGLYGRGYQLINIPTQNLNGAIGGVAFAAFSRLQGDPARLKSYFLKYYALINSLTVPTTLFCVVFAKDIIAVALGPKWADTIPIFRLLAPTVLIFGIVNPLAWLLLAIGLQTRSLKIALVVAPLSIMSYVIGLPFGPEGVAFAYSTVMLLWLVPHVLWCLHGTSISPGDILVATSKPFLSAILATVVTLGAAFYILQMHSPLLRLAVEGGIMAFVYYGTLLFVMGEKNLYVDVFRELRGSVPSEADSFSR